jgi:hypothetical protein
MCLVYCDHKSASTKVFSQHCSFPYAELTDEGLKDPTHLMFAPGLLMISRLCAMRSLVVQVHTLGGIPDPSIIKGEFD